MNLKDAKSMFYGQMDGILKKTIRAMIAFETPDDETKENASIIFAEIKDELQKVPADDLPEFAIRTEGQLMNYIQELLDDWKEILKNNPDTIDSDYRKSGYIRSTELENH